MRIALHSKAAAVAVSVLALGSVAATGFGAASPAAGLTAKTASGAGYWLAGSDGGVFAFGSAHFYGSLAGKHLNAPISEIVPTSDEHGYWLVGRDGAVYSFGDATSKGSMSGKALAGPIVSASGTGGSAGTGQPGATGATGARGVAGPTGPAGPVGSPDYSYVFNTAAENVSIEADIIFSTNGPLRGFTHTAGTSQLTASDSGTYRVEFSVSGVEPGQFALMLNGTVVSGATYGSGAGTQGDDGHVIVDLGAGDVLTVRNHSSSAAVTLQTLAGGTQTNVNASILVEQIGQPAP